MRALILLALLAGCAQGYAGTLSSLMVEERAIYVASERLPDLSAAAQHKCVQDAKPKRDRKGAKECQEKIRAQVLEAEKAFFAADDKNREAREMIAACLAAPGCNPKQIEFWVGEATAAYIAAQAIAKDLGYKLGGL